MDSMAKVDVARRLLAQSLSLIELQEAQLRPLVARAEALFQEYLHEEQENTDELARLRHHLREAGDTGDAETTAALRREEEERLERGRQLLGEVTSLRNTLRRLDLALEYTVAARQALADDAAPEPPSSALGRERLLAAQEEERYRLARDVHDGPAQVLANLTFEIQYCERLLDKDPAALREELLKIQNHLREGLAEVRHFIFDLRPPALADLGLEPSLRRYVQEYQDRFGIEVDLQIDEAPERLTSTQEVAIFRIIQEALQNTRKHARATQVRLTVERGPDYCRVVIKDNGVGFDPPQTRASGKKTLGLVSMRERAELVGGTLEVTSKPGNGTQISLSVPTTLPDE